MSMGTKPRVSVLLPVYNDIDFLGQSIQSVLNQTFSDFELLILDDGSDVQIKDIICTYEDPRVQYHCFEHQGLTKTLNKGLALCRADYIARQDSDDISMPQRFARQVEFLDAYPDVALVGSNCWHIDETGTELMCSNYPTRHEDILRYMEQIRNPFPHSSVMFRRSVIQELGGYNEHFPRVQDYELWLRVSEHFKVAILEDTLCKIRYRKKSISKASGPDAQRKYAILAYLLHLRRLKGMDEFNEDQWERFVDEYDQWFSKNIAGNMTNMWALRMEMLSSFVNGEILLAIKTLCKYMRAGIKQYYYRNYKNIIKQVPYEWLMK